MIKKKLTLPWPFVLLFIVIWVLIASSVLGLWSYLRPQNEWQTITNDQYHFSVDYPSKWTARIYGEGGFRSAEDVKLRIYRSLTGYFEISILYKEADNPDLDDVADWGMQRIDRLNRNKPQSRDSYEEMQFRSDFVEGNEVYVRRYGDGEMTYEEVYIARENDMIIIRLQSEAEDFDQYLDDFNRIVSTFHTLD